MTTFLFGVLLAFTIARTRERLVLIRELMSEGNAVAAVDPPDDGGLPRAGRGPASGTWWTTS